MFRICRDMGGGGKYKQNMLLVLFSEYKRSHDDCTFQHYNEVSRLPHMLFS